MVALKRKKIKLESRRVSTSKGKLISRISPLYLQLSTPDLLFYIFMPYLYAVYRHDDLKAFTKRLFSPNVLLDSVGREGDILYELCHDLYLSM